MQPDVQLRPPLPAGFVKRMAEQLGQDAAAFFAALDAPVPASIRLNPLKPTNIYPDAEPIPWNEHGRYLHPRPAYVFDPLYHAGTYYAQEASSMFFGSLIAENFDGVALDMCAAPGGKSSLLLSMMGPNGVLVSNELVGQRALVLRENLTKWGSHQALITCSRPEKFLSGTLKFDLILLDAPCSGEGMMRKDDAARTQWSQKLVENCAAIQRQLLDTAHYLLADGGTLIYSTCTFAPEENQMQMANFIKSHPEYQTPVNNRLPDGWGVKTVEINADSAGYAMMPHLTMGEGLFVCALKKEGELPAGKIAKPPSAIRPLKKEEVSATGEFVNRRGIDMAFVNAKQQVELLSPKIASILTQLPREATVISSGILAGSFNRNHFLPDHHLAMSKFLNEQSQVQEMDLSAALHFLARETVATDFASGLVLASFKGQPIGWGKAVNGRLNNRYPQEWRIRKTIPF